MKNKYSFLILITLFLLQSCSNGPKVIAPTQTNTQVNPNSSTGIFDEEPNSTTEANPHSTTQTHIVSVNEVLPTEKYVYLNVSEGDEKYWVATSKQEVIKGEKYSFSGGLLKTNFVSKEYNRTFDKVYLVSGITPLNPTKSITSKPKPTKNIVQKTPIQKVPGSVSIAEIINNPKKYTGSPIQVSGQCTKLNANIMGKNWIHLKDGSADDYDFVITSDIAVPEGHNVTMKGDLILDKDFGAGYRYEILVENAIIVQ